MDIGAITQQMFILLIMIGVGYVAGKANVIDKVSNARLSGIVLTITMPCMILASVMTDERVVTGRELAILAGCTVFFYGFLYLLSLILPGVLRAPKEEKGMYRFMCMFANVGFMGFPVTAAIFGEGAVFLAAVFQMGFSILSYTLGVYFITGGEGGRFDWRCFLQPGVIAAVLAVILYLANVQAPVLISRPVTLIGNITTPAAMLVIGASLSTVPVGKIFTDVRIYFFAVIRLIAVPLIIYGVLQLFVESQLLLGLTVTMSAMPVAAMSAMVAAQYDTNLELASKSIFITAIISVITIPFLMWLLFVR